MRVASFAEQPGVPPGTRARKDAVHIRRTFIGIVAKKLHAAGTFDRENIGRINTVAEVFSRDFDG